MKKHDKSSVIHGSVESDGGNHHVVGFGNLRVVITNDEDAYFAQALDFDYGTAGRSLEDAQRRFEAGLRATVEEHLRRFDSIQGLLKPVPEKVWNEVFAHWANLQHYRYSDVMVHSICNRIDYFELKAA